MASNAAKPGITRKIKSNRPQEAFEEFWNPPVPML
jgi:hypothetical protein